MQAVKVDRPAAPTNSTNRLPLVVIILILLLVVGIYVNNAYTASQASALPKDMVTISQSTLEEKYGLHVNLVAVTGAGGFVDLRLKMVDAEKAKLLLADRKAFPALFTAHGTTLNAPEETKSQNLEFVSGRNLFIMYPNSSNAVRRGETIRLLFGDIALEAINVK